MRKLFLLTALIAALISCGTKETRVDSGLKFYYDHSEGYLYAAKLKKTGLILKMLPQGFELDKRLFCAVSIIKHKEVYFPGADSYIECGIYVLASYKKIVGWYPLSIFVDIPPYKLKPYTAFKLKSSLVTVKYTPSGANFTAKVKRNYNLFLEFEFSFLPREHYKKNMVKECVFTLPVLIKSGKNKLIKISDYWAGEEKVLNIKDGMGAFLFHKTDKLDLTYFNSLKLLDVFYFEKKGRYTKKAYLVQL